jgi:hypothetical protein
MGRSSAEKGLKGEFGIWALLIRSRFGGGSV